MARGQNHIHCCMYVVSTGISEVLDDRARFCFLDARRLDFDSDLQKKISRMIFSVTSGSHFVGRGSRNVREVKYSDSTPRTPIVLGCVPVG